MNDQITTEKFIETKKGKIFYHVNFSFFDRPTVVLLHGLSSNHTTWLNIMDILHKKGYNSVAPDLRGHGLSDKTKNRSNYNLNVFSEDLREILEKEKIGNFIVVGYSFGGQVAIDFVSRFPKLAKGLIVISANHANPLEYAGLKFLTPIFYWCINLSAYLMLWQKRGKYHYYQHGKSVGYWDSVKDGLRTMPVAVNFWMLANEFRINLRDAVKKIKIPAVIVYGKKDAFITKKEVNEISKEIPDSKIIISNNPDHFVGSNAQDETTEIILNFLKNYENSNF